MLALLKVGLANGYRDCTGLTPSEERMVKLKSCACDSGVDATGQGIAGTTIGLMTALADIVSSSVPACPTATGRGHKLSSLFS